MQRPQGATLLLATIAFGQEVRTVMATAVSSLELIPFCGVLLAAGGGFAHAEQQAPYPADFRARIVELVRSGRTVRSVAREFNVSDTSIRSWVRQPTSTPPTAQTV